MLVAKKKNKAAIQVCYLFERCIFSFADEDSMSECPNMEFTLKVKYDNI